ncbi:MAG TPA: rhomboid family intramembrane serine protease [Solirubrobacterales bacterium]|jgi:membrane associated rhomboid family serine protease/DNA-directed RNA polymerase subunit RPC12/RpoP|nr:rhomboid family intramembrane serine protease [Solirubrobacterales bacterium]HMU26872.1 rhomboid family intramembrane serine protease [Solirubrobacterales bacterium]HMW44567.1 rhomboid family intramembrane serine protease [Solirubrobacterales bacterium]HMX71838.1 rhomboid family intramembrane serine protease [Solirubrobacterales bacterium]HMY25387.1 rhomboid family intramembrane serine protease [Solirubrobacterales bacterium]
MSETELNVVCKSCGAEVSPYVTECPYCGARLRKRAPDLELGGDGGLEPKQSRREKRREEKARQKAARRSGPRPARAASLGVRPWATISLILIPAVALIVRIALGNALEDFGGVIVPVQSEWWRILTAPFAYLSVGYLFAVGLALALFGPGIERRFGTVPTFLLLVACGALGVLAASAVADQREVLTVIAGGNGIALGAIGAWFMVARSESRATGDGFEAAGAIVSAAVILLLPVVVPTADFWSGLAGGIVGVLAGFTATRFGSPR